MAGAKKKTTSIARAKLTDLTLMPKRPARIDTALDDDLRTRELILFVRCLFGKPGLQIADYAGTLTSTVIQTTNRGAQKHGTARAVQAA